MALQASALAYIMDLAEEKMTSRPVDAKSALFLSVCTRTTFLSCVVAVYAMCAGLNEAQRGARYQWDTSRSDEEGLCAGSSS